MIDELDKIVGEPEILIASVKMHIDGVVVAHLADHLDALDRGSGLAGPQHRGTTGVETRTKTAGAAADRLPIAASSR